MNSLEAAKDQASAVRIESETLVKFLKTDSIEDWYRPTGLGEWQAQQYAKSQPGVQEGSACRH